MSDVPGARMRLAKLAGELDGMKTKRSREIAAEIQRIVDEE
jgi:hypothetical protein